MTFHCNLSTDQHSYLFRRHHQTFHMLRIKYHIFRYRWLTATGIMVAPSLVLMLLVTTHVIPLSRALKLAYDLPTPIPNAARQPLQISSDPYTNSDSQHHTEVEP